MRFFEFAPPKEGSAFAKELEQFFNKLILKAKSLPETDPKRQEFNDYLLDLKNNAGVKEDVVANVSAELIKNVLLKSGIKEATFALMDMAKILQDTAVQNQIQQLISIGIEKEKEQRKQTKQGFDDLGKLISKKLSQPEDWGVNIVHQIQASDIEPELLYVFLDQCVNGTAMNWPFKGGMQSVNFKSLLSKEANEVLSNKKIVDALMTARWATGASGKATGDGEVFIGFLANASHEEKGDIVVGDTPYEVKATKWGLNKTGDVKSTEAWLDAGPYAEDIAGIKNIFSELVNSRNISVDKNVMAAADFRRAGVKYLTVVMSKIKDPENLLVDLHLKIFPNLKDDDVRPGIKEIIQSNYNHLVSAKEQGIMAMKQYSSDSPGNFGFIFIYKTTLSGTVSVNAFESHESFKFSNPISMSKVSTKEEGKQSSKRKAVPGITIGNRETAQQALGWTSKRDQKKSSSTQSAVSPMTNDPDSGFWSKYDKNVMSDITKKYGKDTVLKSYNSSTLADFENQFGLR